MPASRTLVECVPNFSEGSDRAKIREITDAMEAVEGVTLLDVDPGRDTNRTVVTLVGSVMVIEEAAFQGIRMAAEVLDMREHHGAHPRMGATDVCPFIPVSGVTMEECVNLSKHVARRVGQELNIPVYLYEHSAQDPRRQNLATIRAGEYEGLEEKLKDPDWKPDYGPATFNAKAGATVMGCREFLIAYNINLNTQSKRLANDIAFDLREKGRSKRIPDPRSKNTLDGEIVRYGENHYPCGLCDAVFPVVDELVDHNLTTHEFDVKEFWGSIGQERSDLAGKAVKQPGLFKHVKAIGWTIDAYKRAQISINFTDYKTSPIHDVFDSACELAWSRGVRVTGSELVGLIPLEAMLMAGRHYREKQEQTQGVPERELVETAVQSLGLNDVTEFDPRKKIIDYAVQESSGGLMDLRGQDFLAELSSNSPAPGGGSVSALAGGLGAALVSMVAVLTHEKKEFLDRRSDMEALGVEAQTLKDRLSELVQEDTEAFNRILAANRLPSGTKEERGEKARRILAAQKEVIQVPLETARLSLRVLELAREVVTRGNPNSVSDGGVAGEVALAGVRGACMNVRINLGGLKEEPDLVESLTSQCDELVTQAEDLYTKISIAVTKSMDV